MSNLSITKLSKTYNNGVKALNNLSLEIGPGMFGLLGPNGAGKSTLMRTIATLQDADSGEINFNGINVLEDPMSLRKALGYLPQEFGVYPKESAENMLGYFAILKGISSKSDRANIVQQVLEITNLFDVRKKNVSDYSGGMRQRFGIAQLLLNDPRLIIVDEPTAGLDPAERKRFLNVLREIGTTNTVIFSTHIVDDVKELCNNMAVINQGKVLMSSTPGQAIKEVSGKIWTRKVGSEQSQEIEENHLVLSSNFNNDNSINIRVYSDAQPSPDFTRAEPRLEDVYFIALKEAE